MIGVNCWGHEPVELKEVMVEEKLNWLIHKDTQTRRAWRAFRKEMTMVNRKNFLKKFKESTGRGLEKKMNHGPKNWKERMLAAMYAIREKLKV